MIYKYSQLRQRIPYEKLDEYSSLIKNKPVVHWGQLKLLLSEIFFITKFSDKPYNILYVGAAQGYHINHLTKMFPKNKFILWDPGNFAIKPSEQVEIHNDFFTSDVAKGYSKNGSNILFICDIRNISVGTVKENIKEFDEIITADMEKQKEWVQLIQPHRAFLKFRLPYLEGITNYFSGPIYLQQYAPRSTEARILVKDYNKLVPYDHKEFDEKMAFFNAVIRKRKYKIFSNIIDKLHIVNNWDSTMMIYIVRYYFQKYKRIDDPPDNIVYEMTNTIINYLAKSSRSSKLSRYNF